MRRLWGLSLAAFSFCCCVGFAQTQALNPFPRLRAESGQVLIKQKGEELKGQRQGRTLRESILVETQANSLVRLDFSPTEYVVVGPNSRLLLPGIDWESGRVEELDLLEGRIFLDLQEPRILRSALFRESLSRGRYEFSMETSVPRFEVLVFEGELLFRGLETEAKSKLTGGESQVFQGELEDSKIQYDVLLEGRRVARGKLGPKARVQNADLVRRANAYLIPEKKKVKPKSEDEVQAQAGVTPGQVLCQKPAGLFNQCSYICENKPAKAKDCPAGQMHQKKNVQCVRRRCLASGQWGDLFIYPDREGPCEAKDRVRNCDY